ncbi:ubiquinol-cytochrome-c reductase complex assembly factor 3 [Pristis pectinata]|uniref:ubiquinol-cytochrome-c reductase complex assembly factor 3 n=1 Tax=Pristis pectinata TaxID=685728 RepID=UPI00223DC1B4|nr:ubiquinol-cytochrome-c reductase complex assembly factor 3 [Pristis pectinata]
MSGRSLVLGGGALLALGAGWASWMAMGPSEQRKNDIAKHLPESKQAQWEESRHRNALVMEAIKKSAETQKNVASGTDWKKALRSDP